MKKKVKKKQNFELGKNKEGERRGEKKNNPGRQINKQTT